MDIDTTQHAAKSGILRVWLHRVPISSDTIYAFRIDSDGATGELVGQATVYGRGEGSTAAQRVMLYFRLNIDKEIEPLRAGETLRLKTRNPANDTFDDVELYILSIE